MDLLQTIFQMEDALNRVLQESGLGHESFEHLRQDMIEEIRVNAGDEWARMAAAMTAHMDRRYDFTSL